MSGGRADVVAISGVLVALAVTGLVAGAVGGGGGGGVAWSTAATSGPDASTSPAAAGSGAGQADGATSQPLADDVHEVDNPVTSSAVQAAPEWVAATAAATGIGTVALRAYGNATLRLADEQPGCHLDWATLAGIGAIESGHGTSGGAVLGEDGRPSVSIIGPALDGSSGTLALRSDEESQAWHGDPVWEHAVGPLQFLPSTWRTWGADGDGDGVADPQDIDDAALAAGRYLCADGHDLSTGVGWTAAVRSYNHSDEYVDAVRVRASAYATASQ